MNLYLADIIAHPNYIGVEKKMTLFLAGEHTIKNGKDMCKFVTDEQWSQMFILESYYYARKNVYFPALRSKCKDLLLDSGAFSVMDSGMRVDSWDRYIEEYAAYSCVLTSQANSMEAKKQGNLSWLGSSPW